ncbi:carbon storage regulator CsrA [bacterium]|nr:MAG: carbon storage regulator [candidate division KSB1 bacterium]MCE7944556.1 carbon storage regulator [Chlorobi bacterium CHB1]MCL4704820.1 carbon storage regulator CsrA [bacterium]MDL1874928.1 carbon storage regulator CsrA [Cytophagia bacterium CHB2]MBC6950960.1 carbon storage regulator [candidate division KSB1 bacterium]
MLVLTRRLGETIVIGDDIVIKIVDIHGKQIRVGIEAPAEISVYRGEIYERIMLENKAAVEAALGDVKAMSDGLKELISNQTVVGHSNDSKTSVGSK